MRLVGDPNVQNAQGRRFAASCPRKEERSGHRIRPALPALRQRQYNAQVPETVYNNAMQKANAVAGAMGSQANLAQKQAENPPEQASLIGVHNYPSGWTTLLS